MRVLTLAKYDRQAASGRLRFLQYADHLATRGIELVWAPLFDDAYLRDLFAGKKPARRTVVDAYARRVRDVAGARHFDAAIIHLDALPYLPRVVEAALGAMGVPYVFDFDDAIHHAYDMHQQPLYRRLMGDKVARVIRGAAAVTAGSGYLVDYASRHSAHVHFLPTVVDTDAYRVREHAAADPVTIGWIGSPSTTRYLNGLGDALRQVAATRSIRVLAVGAGPIDLPGVEAERRPWVEEREIDDLLEMDIGIMPLTDDPWSRGKCAFKLIQYMACGLPAVASPVGANAVVVSHETGRLADSTEAWARDLTALVDDAELRARLGSAGRRRIVEEYSLTAHADRFADILLEVGARPRD